MYHAQALVLWSIAGILSQVISSKRIWARMFNAGLVVLVRQPDQQRVVAHPAGQPELGVPLLQRHPHPRGQVRAEAPALTPPPPSAS